MQEGLPSLEELNSLFMLDDPIDVGQQRIKEGVNGKISNDDTGVLNYNNLSDGIPDVQDDFFAYSNVSADNVDIELEPLEGFEKYFYFENGSEKSNSKSKSDKGLGDDLIIQEVIRKAADAKTSKRDIERKNYADDNVIYSSSKMYEKAKKEAVFNDVKRVEGNKKSNRVLTNQKQAEKSVEIFSNSDSVISSSNSDRTSKNLFDTTLPDFSELDLLEDVSPRYDLPQTEPHKINLPDLSELGLTEDDFLSSGFEENDEEDSLGLNLRKDETLSEALPVDVLSETGLLPEDEFLNVGFSDEQFSMVGFSGAQESELTDEDLLAMNFVEDDNIDRSKKISNSGEIKRVLLTPAKQRLGGALLEKTEQEVETPMVPEKAVQSSLYEDDDTDAPLDNWKDQFSTGERTARMQLDPEMLAPRMDEKTFDSSEHRVGRLVSTIMIIFTILMLLVTSVFVFFLSVPQTYFFEGYSLYFVNDKGVGEYENKEVLVVKRVKQENVSVNDTIAYYTDALNGDYTKTKLGIVEEIVTNFSGTQERAYKISDDETINYGVVMGVVQSKLQGAGVFASIVSDNSLLVYILLVAVLALSIAIRIFCGSRSSARSIKR